MKISELPALTTLATGDLLPVVDISDTSESASGTTKRTTAAQVLAGYQPVIAVYPSITGLSGGGSTKLASLVTVTGTTPTLIITPNLAAAKMWQLAAGTDTTAPGIQRPDDFDATNNAFIWKSVL